jgi:Peptidase M50B-like
MKRERTAGRKTPGTMSTKASARSAPRKSTADSNAVVKRKIRFIAGFTLYFVALWFLWNTPVVYPLKVFVVMLHEISHGIAAVATGGAIRNIQIDFNEGGSCLCPGGNAFITLSAGYLGSLAWGAGLLVLALGKPRRHKITLMLIGAFLSVVTLLYVRNVFGVFFGLAAGFALIGAARTLPTAINKGILTVLGLTSCLYAILDIKSDVIDRPDAHSDAYMLAQLTHVHTLVWGGLWIVIALVVSGLLLRRIWRKA